RMTENLEKFEFGIAMSEFEKFFWHEFCDNYLEMIKNRIYKPELFTDGESKKLSAQYTLYTALNTILKLIAPYLPHITEEIYQDYFRQFEDTLSIHLCSYPQQIAGASKNTAELNKS